MSAGKLYPDPGSTVVVATGGRHGFEDLDGRSATVFSWDGNRGTVLVSVRATEGERAQGKFDRRVEVARDEVEHTGLRDGGGQR